jgi:ABC-2 type transport system ATP-binding protein
MLDEPASGLDPEARIGLAGALKTLCAEGMTIIVSSHILAELDDYSTHILMIRGGRIVEHGPLSALGSRIDDHATISVELAVSDARLGEILAATPGIVVRQADDRRATFSTDGNSTTRQALLKGLVDAGLPVIDFTSEKPRLQDAYLARMRVAGGKSG